jgi:hypothetical protein
MAGTGNIQDVTDIKIAEDKTADKAKEINDTAGSLTRQQL